MRRYALIFGGLVCFFLAAFLLAEAVQMPLLTDPAPWLRRGGPLAAALGVGLLVADVFLPVPSSVVMVMHGTMFGVVVGSLLSLAGSLGAAALGFAVGRRGERLVTKVVSAKEKARADELLRRWGATAIVITRPVPLLAETVAVLAGTSPISWGTMLGASFLGAAPGALIYAAAGALAPGVGNAFVAFGIVILLAGVTWWVGWRRLHRGSQRHPPEGPDVMLK